MQDLMFLRNSFSFLGKNARHVVNKCTTRCGTPAHCAEVGNLLDQLSVHQTVSHLVGESVYMSD